MAKLLAMVLVLVIPISLVSCMRDFIVEGGVSKWEPHSQQNGNGGNGGNGKGNLTIKQCQGECERRCSRTQHTKPCTKACLKCCQTCLCVPPGFYGNREACPCYNNLKTQHGLNKCP